MVPLFAAYAQFAPDQDPYSGNPYAGAQTPGFNAAYGTELSTKSASSADATVQVTSG